MNPRCTPASPRLGYLLRTFPVLSETFVAGEIRRVAALSGRSPVVAALYRPGPGQGGGWEPADGPAARYWQDTDKRCLGELASAQARLLASAPTRTLGCLLGRAPEGLSFFERVKASALAVYFQRQGVGHLHSHFAWEQADMLAYLHRLTGMPFSLTLHAADIFVSPDRLVRRVARAAFLATISGYNRNLLAERFGIPRDTIHIVHCGVDLSLLEPAPLPELPAPRLVSIGRMVAKKGFDVLLRAVAQLRAQGLAVEADLVGDGPLREELMALAGQLDLGRAVRFHGALAPREALSLLRAGQACALACRVAPDGDMDGIPVVLMEAMALGRPVVSTRLSGIPELVAQGCGLLADPEDVPGLAQALRLALTDRDLALSLAAAGRRQVESHFTLDGQAQRILALAAGPPVAEGA